MTYIQRKPHPNGLLLYLLGCAVEHPASINGVPFILDFLPHLVVNDTAPDDTIFQFKERWAHNSPFPNIIGDAAFGSEAMINQLQEEEVHSLFSMASDSHPSLWAALSAGLTPNTWRSAISRDGIVASVHMCKDPASNKTTLQQVMSTIHTGDVSKCHFVLYYYYFYLIC